MDTIIDDNKRVIVFVGKNGEGKTYHLNLLLSQHPNTAIYISEDGIVRILNQRNKVTINYDNNKYIYVDEKQRGNRSENEQQQINEKSYEIINYCNKVINSIKNIKNKSHGQKKLQSIIEIFTSYNFNNIKYVLFDEPENFLDEEYLKVVAELFLLLLKNEYNVRIATHNSVLLLLLNINIEDIIVLSNRKSYCITYERIKYIFACESKEIEIARRAMRLDEESSIRYKLSIHNHETMFLIFLENYINSIEFYRSLFYKHIIVVEGISDFEALSSINYTFDKSVHIFVAHGKVWTPFFAKLFLEFNKEVSVVIDVDEGGHALAITSALDNISNIRVVKHDPDLEGFYGIDKEHICKSLGMPNKLINSKNGLVKRVSAYCHFKDDKNREDLINHIFENENSIYDFE